MASFAPIRGTSTNIGLTPIVDGQLLIETDQGANNKIYLDNGSSSGDRIIVGGNADYIYVDANEGVIAGTTTTASSGQNITFTNAYITDNSKLEVFSEKCTGTSGVPATGNTNALVPLSFSNVYVNGTTVTVHVTKIPNGSYYKFTLKVSN